MTLLSSVRHPRFRPALIALEDRAVPANFVVTTDADTLDGGTLADPTGADGLLSLREAITVANLSAGADTIQFAIPGGGVRTITLGSSLPTVVEDLAIDGFTQSGASPSTLAVGDNAVRTVTIDGGLHGRIFRFDDGTAEAITATLRGMKLSRGNVAGDGGAVLNQSEDVTVDGVEFTSNHAHRGGALAAAGGTTTVRLSRFESNITDSLGGAVYLAGGDLRIEHSTVRNNLSAEAGALFQAGGSLVLDGVTVERNTTNFPGVSGGALLMYGGTAHILGSTFVENGAPITFGGQPTWFTAYGGGIRMAHDASAVIEDSTFSGNSARLAGGGIYTDSTGSLVLRHVTMTGNTAVDATSAQGGGLWASPQGPTTLFNTAIAGNLAAQGTDVSGPAAGRGNLIGAGGGMTGLTNGVNFNRVGTVLAPLDAKFVPLADIGGWTRTHAVLASSPALDAADLTAVGTLTTDQRGFARIDYGAPDIGAFEFQSRVVTTDADTLDGGTLADPDGVDDLLSLREAVTVANLQAGWDRIVFAIPGGGVRTIDVGSAGLGALPTITDSLTIDGYTQAGASANTLAVGDDAVLQVVLSGSNAGLLANGLTVQASETTIRGLSIGGFSNYGIALESGDNNRIGGNFVGVDAAGTASHGNRMGGIFVQTAHNAIGGSAPADRNVISANGIDAPYGPGLLFFSPAAFDNRVHGNYIGPAADGVTGLGNVGYGIVVGYAFVVGGSGAAGNFVGGVNPGEGNVLSWNGVGTSGGGILLIDTYFNQVRGNRIGTDATGLVPLGNDGVGVRVQFGGQNVIGGSTASARNVIADTAGDGIQLLFTTGNFVVGNLIGTNAGGFTDVTGPGPNSFGNAGHGIAVYGSANNLIGGALAGNGNLISGNKEDGIRFGTFNNDGQVVGSTNNIVQGNRIGTRADGTVGMGNGRDGIFVSNSSHNTIGGTTPGARNIISGNGNNGIGVSGGTITPDGNIIQGNYIGTTAAGTAAIGNRSVGIGVSGATNTVIGGADAGAGNVVSGNAIGIALGGTGTAAGTVVQGNRIGTDASGTAALGNYVGVGIAHSSGNTIGGTATGAGNVISGNALAGVVIVSAGATTTGNQLLGNAIGTAVDRVTALGNGGANPVPLTPRFNQSLLAFDPTLPALTTQQVAALDGGVVVWGASGNTIGGTAPGAGNVIADTRKAAGNFPASGNGVTVDTGTGNRISGNDFVANEGLGIDLVNHGNTNQPSPGITSVTRADGTTTIGGSLVAAPNTTYALEFFATSVGPIRLYYFVGTGTVTTDATGGGTFEVTVPVRIGPFGATVTATATSPTNDTSEFSSDPTWSSIPPSFTTADRATFTAGQAGSFFVAATGVPTPELRELAILPSWLSFVPWDSRSGYLVGTPPAGSAGTYQIAFEARSPISSRFSFVIQGFTLTVVGGPVYVTGAGPGGGPQVTVFDGRTGEVVRSFHAYDGGFGGGVRVAVGDVTGDGTADIVTAPGPGGGPHVKVFDGVSGAEVRSFYAYDLGFAGGVSVAVSDVNGDGFADIVTGAGAGGGPNVRVFDGRTGALLRSFYAYDPSFLGGVSVTVGDLNGDGHLDIVTAPGAGGGPNVRTFDGTTGNVILSFLAYDRSFTGGVSVAVGDVDGDGHAEIVTGAGPGGTPQVNVYDGTTAAVRSSFQAYDPSFRGGVAVATRDVNGDGRVELATTPRWGGGPHLRLWDGRTGGRLWDQFAFDAAFLGGLWVG